MESGFVKEVTKEMDVQEGKVEHVILFHFCIGRKQSSNLTKLWVRPGDFAKVVGINIFKLLRIGKK